MKNLLIFVTGAAIGSVATWYMVKDHYTKLAQEEIDSVKERFSYFRMAEQTEQSSEATEDKQTYEEIAANYKSNDYAGISAKSIKKTNETVTDEISKKESSPYVITPDEFGEIDEYDTITLIHYSDGVLTDDNDVKVSNWTEIVAPDYLDHFGEYEADSVFVRNDRLKADYEILYDHSKYADVILTKPYNMRD